jgi:hypothetical protein
MHLLLDSLFGNHQRAKAAVSVRTGKGAGIPSRTEKAAEHFSAALKRMDVS